MTAEELAAIGQQEGNSADALDPIPFRPWRLPRSHSLLGEVPGCHLPRADPLWLGGQVFQGFKGHLFAWRPSGHPEVDRCFMTCDYPHTAKCRGSTAGLGLPVSREAVCAFPCMGSHAIVRYVLGHTESPGLALPAPGMMKVEEDFGKQHLRTPGGRCPTTLPSILQKPK